MRRISGVMALALAMACSEQGIGDDLEDRAAFTEDGDGALEGKPNGDGEPAGESDYAAHPPQVSKIEVELASPEPSEPARVFITYAEDLGVEEIAITLEDGEPTTFNDVGQWPDELPGDGVFTGHTVVDLAMEAELAWAYLDRVGQQPDPISPRFEGRRLVGVEPFDPTPLEQRTMLGDPAMLEALVGQRFALYDAESGGEGGEGIELGAPEGLAQAASDGAAAAAQAFAADVSPTAAPPLPPPSYAPTHDWEKTLFVRDIDVIEDVTRTNVWSNANGTCQMVGTPTGVWSFQTLMENMANPSQTGIDLHEFVTDWVLHWEVSHNVQGDIVPAGYMGLYELWNNNTFSGWPRVWDDGNNGVFNDVLDMEQAPFRLIAIVNRVDLRGGGAYGGAAGELRFVFEMIDPVTYQPRPFNVILEFGVPIHGCNAIRQWGKAWYDLDQYTLGSATYNDALANLTEQVTSVGAMPKKPNGSAINQVRTNENFMVWPHYPSRNWQLREFKLDPSGYLKIAPLVQTPTVDWEVPALGTGIAPIDDYISSNVSSILAGTYLVGPSWNGQSPFQGGFSGYGEVACYQSPCTTNNNFALEDRGLWWGTANSGVLATQREARHEFSLGTCNGCHGRETLEDANALVSVPSATPDKEFRHVEGHGPGTVASLSRFLTGTHQGCNTTTNMLVPPLGPATNDCASGCCPIGDPVHGYGANQVHFADLLRRQYDLDALVSSSCLISLTPVAAPAVLQLSH